MFFLTRIVVTFILLFFAFFASAQNKEMAVVFHHQIPAEKFEYKPKFILLPGNKIIKYNPISLIFAGLMYTYQKWISPQLSAECSYELSCSNFSKAMIERYGIIKGIALTSDRLCRCSKVAAIDIHPLYINVKGQIIDQPEQYQLRR